MTPPTHAADKRKQILTAARKVLAQNGYAATTIALVAQEAGVSRGLLHYYFTNKEEMLAHVLKANMESILPLIRAVLEQSDSIESFSRNLVHGMKQIMEHNPDYFDLFFEGFAVARQNMVVRYELETQYGKLQEVVCSGLEHMLAAGIIAQGWSIRGLAVLLTGIIDGMALQFVTVSEIKDDEEVWETMRRGLHRLLGSDSSQNGSH